MLYTINVKREVNDDLLTSGEKLSILYHNIFDYPLSFSELIKWKSSDAIDFGQNDANIVSKNGFYFLEGKDGLIYKRALRKRISSKKIALAKRAAKILSLIPTIKMLAVTGSLAMQSAEERSDIDLMVVTNKGSLWTTRALIYFLIFVTGIKFRRAGKGGEANKLCLNIWLDESELNWPQKDRNIYTAHEIAQVEPLINRDHTYEKFVNINKWAAKYWPNAIKTNTKYSQVDNDNKKSFQIVEKLAFKLQYGYMKGKITREVVTPAKAIFHPNNWGKIVLSRLSS